MPAKKKFASAKMSKTDFIRNFGPDASADDVVAKGKEQGITLSKKYVWTKQSEMRKGGGKAPAKVGPNAAKRKRRKFSKAKKALQVSEAAPKAATAKRSVAKSDEADVAQQLRAAILNLGLARADTLYQKVRAEADAFIRRG